MKNPVIIGAPTAAHPVTVKRDGSTVGQRATYEEVVAALKEYGNHPSRCTYWNSDTAPCDCGLDAILARVPE